MFVKVDIKEDLKKTFMENSPEIFKKLKACKSVLQRTVHDQIPLCF